MGRAATASKDFPSGPADGTGTIESGGREWRFQHVSIGNPQCAIVVDADELEGLDLAAIGPGIEGHELFPNRTNVSFLAIDGDRVQGADLRARGGGDALLRDRGQRRRGDRRPARRRRARSRSSSTAASSWSRSPTDLDVTLTGWAEPVCSGELSPELLAALAEL